MVLVLVTACVGQTPEEIPSESGAAPAVPDDLLLAASRVALPPTGIGSADLPEADSRGAGHLVQYCTACHALPHPQSHSATDWPSVVRRMWLRMDRIDPAFNVPVPNGAERLVMAEYLVANALKVLASELPAGNGRELFVSTCSQCHELADPSQHSPEDWVAVLRRMAGHMDEMLGDFLEPNDLQQIALYLQAVSQ
jgi:cytochrome c5